MTKEVKKGTTAVLPVSTLDTEFQFVNPSAGPTIDMVLVNGIDASSSLEPAIEQVEDGAGAPVAGRFNVSVPTAGLQYNAQVQVSVSAVVEGETVNKLLEFTVSSDATRRPQMI